MWGKKSFDFKADGAYSEQLSLKACSILAA
jgi:hypothetical protein